MAMPPPENAAPRMPKEVRQARRLNKGDDIKWAKVWFPKDFKFEFPEVTKNEEEGDVEEKVEEDVARTREEFRKSYGRHALLNRKGAPNFFGL